jgi:hypothetical protein
MVGDLLSYWLDSCWLTLTRGLNFHGECAATGSAAVPVALPSNIGLFDKIANPGATDNESGTGFAKNKKLNYFNDLYRSQLAQQQQYDENDQNDAPEPHSGMAHAVTVAANPAAQAPHEVNDHQNDQNYPERHGIPPSAVRRHGIAYRRFKQSIFQAWVPREERSVEAVTASPNARKAVAPRAAPLSRLQLQ